MNNLLAFICGILLTSLVFMTTCNGNLKSEKYQDSLEMANIGLQVAVSDLEREKDELSAQQVEEVIIYKEKPIYKRVEVLREIGHVVYVDSNRLEIDSAMLDTINLLRIDNHFTHLQLDKSDSIIGFQKQIIGNDSLLIGSLKSDNADLRKSVKAAYLKGGLIGFVFGVVVGKL